MTHVVADATATPVATPIVTPSTIVTDAPRMGAPRMFAPALHVSHDRKARDLG
jgi:hypothetical protein